MGGLALHLCNPGSEVEGADGADEPSTGLVNFGSRCRDQAVASFMVVCQEQGDR